MTEVVGDAAWVVPQNDAHSLAEALQALLEDDARRADLARRGFMRAHRLFTAELVAGKVCEAYRLALGGCTPEGTGALSA